MGHAAAETEKDLAMDTRMNRRAFLVASAAATGLAGRALAQTARLEVYKSPTCGCCSAWIEHMERTGFVVDARNVDQDDLYPAAPIPASPLSAASSGSAPLATGRRTRIRLRADAPIAGALARTRRCAAPVDLAQDRHRRRGRVRRAGAHHRGGPRARHRARQLDRGHGAAERRARHDPSAQA